MGGAGAEGLLSIPSSSLMMPFPQERERAELQDRADDLDNVKEAVRDELLDSAFLPHSQAP